ncbi:MAG: hypothetical protein ACLFTK_02455 [Anaerolineales bacterium]
MTINFFAPDDVPQPPDKIKIERLAAEVQPDRWRVTISVAVTPFQVRPNLAIVLLRDVPAGEPAQVVADLSIIETMHATMEFTMHIRHVDDPQGDYVLKTRLYYQENIHAPQDEKSMMVQVPPA